MGERVRDKGVTWKGREIFQDDALGFSELRAVPALVIFSFTVLKFMFHIFHNQKY